MRATAASVVLFPKLGNPSASFSNPWDKATWRRYIIFWLIFFDYFPLYCRTSYLEV